VSYGKISAATIVKKLKGESTPEEDQKADSVQERFRSLFKRGKSQTPTQTGIRVSGQNDVLVRFGGCCNPLPGDDVVGFVTRGRGVTVHSRGCARVFVLDPERRIDVEWDADPKLSRKVRIRVTSRDKPGILAKITNSISAAGINIAGVKVTTDESEHATQSFDLLVGNAKMLGAVMKEISKVKGVLSVDRVRG
jgi:GTP pyrophosphokinase